MRLIKHTLVVVFILITSSAAYAQTDCLDPIRKSIWQTLDGDILSGNWDCLQTLNVERVTVASSNIYVVRGYGLPFCGATGNCSTWIVSKIGKGYRLILDAGSTIKHYDIHPRGSRQKPDLTFWHRMGSGDHYLAKYRFSKAKYSLIDCHYRVININSEITITKAGFEYCTN